MGSTGTFMTEEEYNLFKGLILREFGIEMKRYKRSTLHSKLLYRLALLDIPTYKDYYDYIVSDPSREELSNIISHIANSETYFQRETEMIAVFAGLLGEIKKQKQKKSQHQVTIFCAGCSTGEEAYTLNIVLVESGLFSRGWDVKLIGMDISRPAIKKAMNAAYKENSFRSCEGDKNFSEKYFDREGNLYILKKCYRSNVEFRHGNLLSASSLDAVGLIDVIFCRNVFIYMNDQAIKRITENFHRHLREEGYLFIGSSESLLGKTDLFVPERRGEVIVYKKT
jgi:chemotaxis protein methyltransferase CheR